MQPPIVLWKAAQETNLAVTAWFRTTPLGLTVFADLLTQQSACSGTTNGAQRAAEDRIAHHTSCNSANASANLGVTGLMSAAAQCQCANQKGRNPQQGTCACHNRCSFAK